MSSTKLQLRAYTNSTHTKEQALALMREHKRLDHIIQGTYEQGVGDTFKGCLVGCATGGDHMQFEPAFGIPWRLAWLADDIFEGLTPADAAAFAVDFFDAIAPGADLSRVYDAWCAWVLGDPVDGLVTISTEPSVKDMAALFARAAAGDEPEEQQWSAAKAALAAWDTSAAWAARAAWAAQAARGAKDTGAAWVAWDAWVARAASAARGAKDTGDARAAIATWADSAARAVYAVKQRDALLRLLAAINPTGDTVYDESIYSVVL